MIRSPPKDGGKKKAAAVPVVRGFVPSSIVIVACVCHVSIGGGGGGGGGGECVSADVAAAAWPGRAQMVDMPDRGAGAERALHHKGATATATSCSKPMELPQPDSVALVAFSACLRCLATAGCEAL